MPAPITEIFRSFQGEGKYIGVPQVFVRFAGCNLACSWCDTPEAAKQQGQRFRIYAVDELIREVKALAEGCHSVSLTGGEPLLQKDFLKEFLPRMGQLGLARYLDTNGVLAQALVEVIAQIDIIAMDLKLPSSTGEPPQWAEHEAFLNIAKVKAVFIKIVVAKATSFDDIKQAVVLIKSTAPEITVVLQPNSFELETGALQKCLEYQRYCSNCLKDVRIVPQIHKILGWK